MIIGLTGYKGSGKSEVAKYLEMGCKFRRERFAGPLKDMMRAVGLTEAQIEGDEKEVPCALLGGATPRWAMQSIGTEWGRQLIHPNLWIMLWRPRVEGWRWVVTDDLRFPNEEKAIRDLGGVVWRVNRPGCEPTGHESESYIASMNADREIDNVGTLHDLHRKIWAILEEMYPSNSGAFHQAA